MNYKLISLNTLKLNKKEITQINKLKDTQWRFGLKSLLNGLKKILEKMIYIIYYTLNLNLLDTHF